jgi:hypothetical protein
MNRIKKLFGICEHKFTHYSIGRVCDYSINGVYEAMHFEFKFTCHNCLKVVIEESIIFSRNDISDDFFHLSKTEYWNNPTDCLDALTHSMHGKLVKSKFYKKLNKKYNLNLTI